MAPRPRHVLITGGSRGIGLAIAQLFAKNAYRCTLISRSEAALKTAISTLQPLPPSPSPTTPAELGPDYSFLALDPSTPDSESATQDIHRPSTPPAPATSHHHHAYIPGDITAQTHFWTSHPASPFGSALPRPPQSDHCHASRIDVLVNCAGITQSALFLKTVDEDINEIVATNLTAMMIGTRFLLRQGYLRGKRGGGKKRAEGGKQQEQEQEGGSPVIINVASLLGLSGGYGAVAYAASKAGVLGFTRALAAEYASHGVRVNALVPGYVASAMTASLDAETLERRIPLGRFGMVEEIADAALFLARNEYAHNCVLNLDGGLSAV